MKVYETREAWLNAFADAMRPTFKMYHAPLPEKIRIAVAFTSGGSRGKRVGECWSNAASADNHFEIMIRPDYDNTQEIAAIVVHELVHAAVGLQEKHAGRFKSVAKLIGLEGKMTSTVASERLKINLAPIIDALGEMPHGKLDFSNAPKKKQATAMIKCECETCGYIVRTTQKWLDIGAPHCNDLSHGEMTVHYNSELGE